MEKLIIQKPALKFTVEVVAENGQLNFNVVRWIEVGKNESLQANAQLAKNDALKIGSEYINCNEMIKGALSGIESKMLPYTLNMKKDCKIRVKKSCHFGY